MLAGTKLSSILINVFERILNTKFIIMIGRYENVMNGIYPYAHVRII